jgi:anti-sigma-K factor RskA
MLAAATIAVLTVLPAGVAQASQAEERGQRVLERTWAREHHAVPAPTNPATQAAELRTQAREQGAYPAPTSQQTANTQPTETSRPITRFALVGMVGVIVLAAGAAAFLWQRGRGRPKEAT